MALRAVGGEDAFDSLARIALGANASLREGRLRVWGVAGMGW